MLNNEYKNRRERLFAEMEPNSIAILPTAPLLWRSADEDYPFSPDNDFYYFTGFSEPKAVAVFIKDNEGEKYLLFNRPRDAHQEQWVGRRVGQKQAITEYQADQAYSIDEFTQHLPELLLNKNVLYVTWGRYADFDQIIKTSFNQIRSKVRTGIKVPQSIHNIEAIITEMRLIKDEAEIALLKKAAEISVLAHKQALQACKPGNYEYQVHAALVYNYMWQGAKGEAYESIVAGGDNANVLHYTTNSDKLHDGDLLLIDSAAKYQGYCADITRTYPVNGRYTAEQKAVYDIVLAAQVAALECAKPGVCWFEMEAAAQRVITQGLLDLGILSGNIESLLEQEAYKPFYMHRIGHWLGLDVHDVGYYKIGEQWRDLQPGMVTTIEPGIYIGSTMDVDQRWRGIGVRIEDNVLITDKGNEVLTAGLPKETVEIEKLMAERK